MSAATSSGKERGLGSIVEGGAEVAIKCHVRSPLKESLVGAG